MKKYTPFAAAVLFVVLSLSGCSGQTQPSAGVVPYGSMAESGMEGSGPDNVSADANDGAVPPHTDGPPPIFASQLFDGTYYIEVKSNSSMFKIVDCQLTVADDELTAVLTLSGTGYEKLYMGTGKEAEADSHDAFIYFAENAEGAYTYEVPVEALDMDIDCAAFSIRKQAWYDRVLVFQAGSIPADAYKG